MGYHIARARVIAALIPLFTAALATAQNIDDDLLYLRAATIDPHQQPCLLATKATPVVSGDYLIKLDGPMTPARRKALRAAGVEPLQLGVMLVVNVTVGLATPPIGNVLFAMSSVVNLRASELVRELLPFLAIKFVLLIIIGLTPVLTTAVPAYFGFR